MPRRRFDVGRQRAFGYYNLWSAPDDCTTVPDLLFSFIASNTAACRGPLFRLRHSSACVEEVKNFVFYDPGSTGYQERKSRYREILERSKFVLCPRGHGTSSVRLYEVMAAGRVPVIISDDWVPPDGPDWRSFSLRWPEGKVDGLIDALERLEGRWPGMSLASRTAYAQFFAPDVAFDRIIGLCEDLHLARLGPRLLDRELAFSATKASVDWSYARASQLKRHARAITTRAHRRRG